MSRQPRSTWLDPAQQVDRRHRSGDETRWRHHLYPDLGRNRVVDDAQGGTHLVRVDLHSGRGEAGRGHQ